MSLGAPRWHDSLVFPKLLVSTWHTTGSTLTRNAFLQGKCEYKRYIVLSLCYLEQVLQI